MDADLLIDAGRPEAEWRRAQRIGASLRREPRLVLTAGCAAAGLRPE
jgi:hypothetical protein